MKFSKSNLNNKLLKGIRYKDFEDLAYDYNTASKIDNKCIYNSKYRSSILIYKATCKHCGCYYIGNTQQHLKNRMNQHFSELINLVNKSETSDYFAQHFTSHFPIDDKYQQKMYKQRFLNHSGIIQKED